PYLLRMRHREERFSPKKIVRISEDVDGRFGSLNGADVRTGKDDAGNYIGFLRHAENLSQFFPALIRQRAIGITAPGAAFLGDSMAQDVDLHLDLSILILTY